MSKPMTIAVTDEPVLTMQSEFAVPILGEDGHVVGVLNAESPDLDGFSPATREAFAAFAAASSSTQTGASLLLTLMQPRCLLRPYISTSTCCWR